MIKLNRFLANFLTEIRNQKSQNLKKNYDNDTKSEQNEPEKKLFGKKTNYLVKIFSIRLKRIIRL